MVYRGDHPIKIGKNEKGNIAQDLKILQMRNARASSGVLLGWHKCNFFDSKIASMPFKRT
jgi:hypothetical protein